VSCNLKNKKQAGGNATGQMPLVAYLRIAQLITVLPISRAQIWRLVKAGTFPQPIKLSANVTAWKASEIQAWLDAKRAGGEGEHEVKAA
jgi:prophage regulatory protein